MSRSLPTTVTVRRTSRQAEDQVSASFSRVVESLGNNVAAGLLGVDKSRVSRWQTEGVPAAMRARVVDLDHLLDRLLLEMTPELAGLWLASPNAHLDFARPVDVLRLRGAALVLAALDAEASGAFA